MGSPESAAFWGGRADGCQGCDRQVERIRRRNALSVLGLFCERKRAAPEGAFKQNSRLRPGIFLPEGGFTPPEEFQGMGSPESAAFWGGRADGCQGCDRQVERIRRRNALSVLGLFCERKRAAPEGAFKQNSRLRPGIFLPEGGFTPPEEFQGMGSPESAAFWGGRADGCQGCDRQVERIRRRNALSVLGLFCERKRAAPEGAFKQNSRLRPGIFLPECGFTPPEEFKGMGSPESAAFWGGRADGCQGCDFQIEQFQR